MADEIILTDLKVDVREAVAVLDRFNSQLARYLHTAMSESLDIVGLRAVQKYMRRTKGVWDKKKNKYRVKGAVSGTDILNIRTGRLARSVLNQYSYAGKSTGELEGIRSVKASHGALIGIIGSKVPYAAIHEFGGTIKRGKTTIVIPKRSYLRRAIEDSWTLRRINQTFTKRVREAIR